MYSNMWIITPDIFWTIIISIIFWLTAKGIVMDVVPRSVVRTATTSFICIMAIMVLPASIVDHYNGSTEWIPRSMSVLEILFPIAKAPGSLIVHFYGVLR